MIDPFIIDGPCLWSFSGGRTSAYMLWRALQSYGGKLPDDHVVAFANTGKEREETLRFVGQVSSRWQVAVVMLEWRPTPAQAERIANKAAEGKATPEIAEWALREAAEEGYAVVGLNSASRKGEPFEALIALKGALPNGRRRWCTQYLKVVTAQAYMRALDYGEPGEYADAIGLRADEIDRVADGWEASIKDGRRRVYPLFQASVTKRAVRAFWWGDDRRYETSVKPQGFDLELPDLWGNCDLCFAMGVAIREERVRQSPDVAPWWKGREHQTGRTFSKRESVQTLVERAQAHKATPDLIEQLDASDAECGTVCVGDAA